MQVFIKQESRSILEPFTSPDLPLFVSSRPATSTTTPICNDDYYYVGLDVVAFTDGAIAQVFVM